jgi:hypothetical protein
MHLSHTLPRILMHLSIAALAEPSRIGVTRQPNAPRVSEEVLSCSRGLSFPAILLRFVLSLFLVRLLLPDTVSAPCSGDNPSE